MSFIHYTSMLAIYINAYHKYMVWVLKKGTFDYANKILVIIYIYKSVIWLVC